jgi:crotonobetainyl-CoA:carnitine CoA-transferase CaiB-like acyl-CoA transferase
MADWGAEVIKVETPAGDIWRTNGTGLNCPITDLENPQFDAYNANKKGIVLDLKKPEAMEAFMKLLATTDIFLTNTRTEALKKNGD